MKTEWYGCSPKLTAHCREIQSLAGLRCLVVFAKLFKQFISEWQVWQGVIGVNLTLKVFGLDWNNRLDQYWYGERVSLSCTGFKSFSIGGLTDCTDNLQIEAYCAPRTEMRLYEAIFTFDLKTMSGESGTAIVWSMPFHTCGTQPEIVLVGECILTYWKHCA